MKYYQLWIQVLFVFFFSFFLYEANTVEHFLSYKRGIDAQIINTIGETKCH